jgi:hypothetical protein
VRWTAVTSADVKTFAPPFRSGVAIEDYQLESVPRAVNAPGSTCCGLMTSAWKRSRPAWSQQELLLRHRSRRIMAVCPAGLTIKNGVTGWWKNSVSTSP